MAPTIACTGGIESDSVACPGHCDQLNELEKNGHATLPWIL